MLNFPPAPMFPEFHAPLLAVEVCVVLSLFVQVTVPPTATVTGFGANAVVVRTEAPCTIDAGVPAVVAGGSDVGADGDEYAPQPNDAARSAAANAIRTFMVVVSTRYSGYSSR
jgi:hypothetical protein